ncbi:MAG TPA: sigma-70 family RNA polymerase sigma factor [Blastocatellia bacterium]|nr:sigma-70 family RNA polymerase sigma factor [Blastocatellia bacterium]
MPDQAGAKAEIDRELLDDLSDEELVDRFLAHSQKDRGAAHACFETLLRRYQWLINHVVRNSHFRFPAWDSADDVIARAGFKIYRGLKLWRRQGKLSSFIARIASSEMIDTIRRVGRDKAWNPHQGPADPDSDLPSPVERAPSREPSPESRVLGREQRETVDRLLADVCRDWKDSVIVNEYIIGNRGAKEISEKYDMSEDLVYQRARRLRVRLMKWLEERGITSAEQLLVSGPGPVGA